MLLRFTAVIAVVSSIALGEAPAAKQWDEGLLAQWKALPPPLPPPPPRGYLRSAIAPQHTPYHGHRARDALESFRANILPLTRYLYMDHEVFLWGGVGGGGTDKNICSTHRNTSRRSAEGARSTSSGTGGGTDNDTSLSASFCYNSGVRTKNCSAAVAGSNTSHTPP